jgi:hypothetical protein
MGVLVVVEAVLVGEVLVVEVLVEAGTVPVVVGPTTDVEVDGGVAGVIGPVVGAGAEVHAPSEPSTATDIAPSRSRRASGEAERHPEHIPCC